VLFSCFWDNGAANLFSTSSICLEDGHFTPSPDDFDGPEKAVRQMRRIYFILQFALTRPIMGMGQKTVSKMVVE